MVIGMKRHYDFRESACNPYLSQAKKQLSDRLLTPRLVLRKPVIADARAMFENFTGDKEQTRFMAAPMHHSVSDAERFIEERLSAWNSGTQWTYALALKENEDEMIGRLGLKSGPHGLSIGYIIARRLAGQGLISEAVSALIPVALSITDHLIGICDTENLASARVFEKTGFQFVEKKTQFMVFPNLGAEARDCFIYKY